MKLVKKEEGTVTEKKSGRGLAFLHKQRAAAVILAGIMDLLIGMSVGLSVCCVAFPYMTGALVSGIGISYESSIIDFIVLLAPPLVFVAIVLAALYLLFMKWFCGVSYRACCFVTGITSYVKKQKAETTL